MTWTAMESSHEWKQRPDKIGILEISEELFYQSVSEKKNKGCLWGVGFRSCQSKVRDLLSLSRFEVEKLHPATDRLVFKPQGTWSDDGVLIQALLCQPIDQHWQPLHPLSVRLWQIQHMGPTPHKHHLLQLLTTSWRLFSTFPKASNKRVYSWLSVDLWVMEAVEWI